MPPPSSRNLMQLLLKWKVAAGQTARSDRPRASGLDPEQKCKRKALRFLLSGERWSDSAVGGSMPQTPHYSSCWDTIDGSSDKRLRDCTKIPRAALKRVYVLIQDRSKMFCQVLSPHYSLLLYDFKSGFGFMFAADTHEACWFET